MLVMTSANISHRPTIYDDAAAMDSLFEIAEAMLTHSRKIPRRMDDSVCLVLILPAIIAGNCRMIPRTAPTAKYVCAIALQELSKW